MPALWVLDGRMEANKSGKQHEVEPNTEETLKPELKTVKYKFFKKFGV